MVASRKPAWHRQFLAMLPMIVRHARVSFRHLDPEAREEAVTEVVANAFCASRGSSNWARPTSPTPARWPATPSPKSATAARSVRDSTSAT